ncbi:hypothetical protein FO519_006795 [Halicephalobus sp. NKZ332]|nr:hypothetical protein FO519_006795 [Halicephalobus sp. NKZ332]
MNMIVTFSILLFFIGQVDSSDSSQKNKCVKQLNSRVSTYLTGDQMIGVIDKQISKISAGGLPENITSGIGQDIAGALTSSQYSTVLTKGLACNSALKGKTITDVVNDADKIIRNNLLSFITQLCNFYKKCQTKGMTNDTFSVKLMDKEIDRLYAGEPPENITSEFPRDAMGILTSNQYSKFMMNGLACNSALGNITIFDVLNNLSNILYNNFIAFITQMGDLYKVYKKKGMTADTCAAKMFGKVNQFLTHERMNTIACRFRSYYTDEQWKAIYKNLNFAFLYDEYPCCIPSSG